MKMILLYGISCSINKNMQEIEKKEIKKNEGDFTVCKFAIYNCIEGFAISIYDASDFAYLF